MRELNAEQLKTIVVTDCGSTTTKAILFERTDNGWRASAHADAPTTVEAPVADVTVGVLNAFSGLEETTGRRFLDTLNGDSAPIDRSAVDAYLSTSSAGGGLQMVVAGLVRSMTAESAERAALGAGAIVLDTFAADDGREEHERVERIRHLRPDIILLAGGVDDGARDGVVELAEFIRAAAPRPRFGDTLKLPVVFAGNPRVASEVLDILDAVAQVSVVTNLRPRFDVEVLGPAREAIHEFFLSHVMSHSPGYGKLLTWVDSEVLPTPAAVGNMIQHLAESRGENVLAVDIGGATTDIFSVFRGVDGSPHFHRTVSANLGMSYSVANVLVGAGAEAIQRWLPYELELSELRDRLRNKMVRPTTIPQTRDDLAMEQAICREALRLSLVHHRSLATSLGGEMRRRTISDIFSQEQSRKELVNLMQLDLVIAAGGVLSHAPNRMQAALMVLDGFALEGVTEIAVDSIFMLPHLGVLRETAPKAAEEILMRDCLIFLAHSVAPRYRRRHKPGTPLVTLSIDGREIGVVRADIVSRVSELPEGEIELVCTPSTNDIDVGAGSGETLRRRITGHPLGLLLDGRNRPIQFPSTPAECLAAQRKVYTALGLEI